MDIKEAVVVAKQHIKELFSGDGEKNYALEEVNFDHESNYWLITISFQRSGSFGHVPNIGGITSMLHRGKREFEIYPTIQKVVRISNKDGTIKSVTNRESNWAA